MTPNTTTLTLFLESDGDLPVSASVWGTGGWLPPEQREALDWMTLARFLGWDVTVVRPSDTEAARAAVAAGLRFVIAGNPDHLPPETLALLTTRVSAVPGLVIAQAGVPNGPWAECAGTARDDASMDGRALAWIGPGTARRWSCRGPLDAWRLTATDHIQPWATLDGQPIVTARTVGLGTFATLGFHPSHARDQAGAATALLRQLLVWGSSAAAAWLDWRGTLILRMDDPGSAEGVHHRLYSHPRLQEADWEAIGGALEARQGRLSIGYVSGWVDDGDAQRGELLVDEQPVPRIPATVHPSPLVRYWQRRDGEVQVLHDYVSEFRGIQKLRTRGLADVELHGHTHLHPDAEAWAKASDRYDSVGWYRELGAAATGAIAARPHNRHPLALGAAALYRFFGTWPTTLICPGEAWTTSVLGRALAENLHLVGSYYLAIREASRFCWVQHVCAPYLDQPDTSWFDAELPVVGYFHDFDLARHGVVWFAMNLAAWEAAGARRVIDYRELAGALGRRLSIENRLEGQTVVVANRRGPPLVRALRLLTNADRLNGAGTVTSVEMDGWRTTASRVERREDVLSLVVEPPCR